MEPEALRPPQNVEVRESEGRGRGVFALSPILAGTLIEEVPVVVIPPEDLAHVCETVLQSYHFVWGGTGDASAIALGYGSLYNHAHDPNAMYVKKFAARTIAFVALRDIAAGEEITVSYNGGIGDDRPVWFEVR